MVRAFCLKMTEEDGRSGDGDDRHGGADEQACEDDGAQQGEGDVVDLDDGHDWILPDLWPGHPAFMPNDIAAGVPVSIFRGNASINSIMLGRALIMPPASWEILRPFSESLMRE
jgi:hypothetical protein